MRRFALTVFALLLAAFEAAPAAAQNPSALGVWVMDGRRARINIYNCAPYVCGQILSLAQPRDPDGQPRRDSKNTSAEERNKTLVRKVVLWNLVAAQNQIGVWEAGRFYEFDTGDEYRAIINLQPDGTLRVRLAPGAVLGAVFTRTLIWTRR